VYPRYLVIYKIRHKGLAKLCKDDDASKVNPNHVAKLRRVLGILDQASRPEDIDLPGLRLHSLRGDYEGFYAVRISKNWRVVFRFAGNHVTDVDYVDYH
jgi:toxin HigB-1